MRITMSVYNEIKSKEVQQKLADKKQYPLFAPADDFCPRCRRKIYAEGGYSVEHAKNFLITGCPFCHYSFCE